MRRVRTAAAALCLLGTLAVGAQAQNTNSSTTTATTAAAAAAAMPQKKSLYDRLGGLDAIKAVIGEFAARVMADERVNKKFSKSDTPRLALHLVEQVCEATGGPCKYTGNSMKKAHKNMKVTAGEFDALVEDLVKALDKFNVPEAEKNELIGALAPMKGDIVEVNSTETGTALPPTFKPAAPLPEKEIKAGPTMKKKM